MKADSVLFAVVTAAALLMAMVRAHADWAEAAAWTGMANLGLQLTIHAWRGGGEKVEKQP